MSAWIERRGWTPRADAQSARADHAVTLVGAIEGRPKAGPRRRFADYRFSHPRSGRNASVDLGVTPDDAALVRRPFTGPSAVRHQPVPVEEERRVPHDLLRLPLLLEDDLAAGVAPVAGASGTDQTVLARSPLTALRSSRGPQVATIVDETLTRGNRDRNPDAPA